jgi:putative SOS response-associated peptidase YedK
MQDGQPFGVAGIWENWKRFGTEDWMRTFAVITCPANELVTEIHDRMPLIIPPESADRRLGTLDPNPIDLLAPYPAPRDDVAHLDAGEQARRRRVDTGRE